MRLLEFYEKNRPRDYETNWHHRWICDILERAYTHRRNVILEVPPRHGKSEIADCYGPAWWIEDHASAMFGLVCNSDSLAKKFSVAVRAMCPHELEIDRDAEWKVKVLESLNYTYKAVGVRGQLTGQGFNTMMFDDLLKSGAEAKSDVIREGVWDGVVSAAISRLSPDGIVIAMQARLHQQDPIGKLLDMDHLKFLHLHLPATNDSGTEAFFRDGYTGEEVIFPAYSALWPTRYSREKLEEIFATIHPYYKAAQYQQVPSMGDLAYFDTNIMPLYKYPLASRVWIAVDAANTQTVKGSYTAFVALGFFEGRLKVLNVKRGRWRQDKMRLQLLDFYETVFRQTGVAPEKVIVEKAAGGFGIIDSLSNQLPIEPIYPLGSKEERAGAVCYLVNRGQVEMPESAPWLKDFKGELENFPLSSTKDQVDAFVHALSYAARPSEFRMQPMDLGTLVIDNVSQKQLMTAPVDTSEFDAQIERLLPAWGMLNV